MAAIAAASINELADRSLLSDEQAEALYNDITHAAASRQEEADGRNNSSSSSSPQPQYTSAQLEGTSNMIMDSPDSFAAFDG